MSENTPTIKVPELCKTHQVLFVRQANYPPSSTWQAALITANVALFQGASADPKVYAEIGGDIMKIAQIGCLACRKPDLFGEIVEVAKTHDLGKVKALGEKWVQAGAA